MSASNESSPRVWPAALLLVLGLCIYPFIWGRQMPGDANLIPDAANRFAYRDWKSIIAPQDEAPPSGFTMYRFYTNRPQQVTHERVPHIMLDSDYPLVKPKKNQVPLYSYDMYAGDAAAYWLGKIRVSKRGKYRFAITHPNVAPMWLRIDVDGKTLYYSKYSKGKPSGEPVILRTLSAGEHQVEGKFYGMSHGYLRLHISPVERERGDSAVRQAIDALQLPGDTAVYVASIIGVQRKNRAVTVELPSEPFPRAKMLILNSSEAVNWHLHGNLPLLVVDNHADSSIVTVDGSPLPDSIPRIHFDDELPKVWMRLKACDCGLVDGRCNDNFGDEVGLPGFAARVQAMTGFPLGNYQHIDWIQEDYDYIYLSALNAPLTSLVEQYEKDKAAYGKQWCHR